MARLTIDWGIDLGTTNSSVSVLGKHGPEVIRNREGSEYTPSAVYLDASGVVQVGKTARERFVSDEANTAVEFKRWMGTAQRKEFKRTHSTLSPEELSAEVLKSLKNDVKLMRGEELEAAVITVPADFDAPQTNATDRAARLAGIVYSPLLQEPVAASLAYGFQAEEQKAFWLVYDFGGGTFDAAVVNIRDGMIHVVAHGGDNQLGGKDIDWKIVEGLLVPILQRRYRLSDFHRGNPKWSAAFGKLKNWAEEAKIRLSDRQRQSTEIVQEYVCKDDDGTQVEIEYTLTRALVESLVTPLTLKAVSICRRVLSEQRIGPQDIQKLILVGGPTLSPHMRAVLEDPKEGLGIPLDFSIDPLTVVARGAAIFAGTQRRPAVTAISLPQGTFQVELEYKPISLDTEPLVGGRVSSRNSASLTGFTIEFVNPDSKPAWRSGDIRLSAEGAFVATLWAEPHRQNTFSIELCDSTGKQHPVEPRELQYTISAEPAGPTLPHHIGIAMANNQMDIFFKRGTALPAKKRRRHVTTKQLNRGTSTQAIRIPVVEGIYPADAGLNRDIGYIEVHPDHITRDVPIGSEIEITLQLDESRRLSGSAYIPILDGDGEFPLRFEGTLERPVPDAAKLKEDVVRQKRRIEQLRGKAEEISDVAARQEISKLDDALAEINQLLAGAREPDAAFTCQNRLLALKAQLADIERNIEAPALKLEGKQEIEWCDEIVEAHGTDGDHQFWQSLRAELIAALDGPREDLRKKIDDAYDLRIRLSREQMWWWVGLHEYLRARRTDMANQDFANKWFTHAERAIVNGDFEALKSGCRQLWALLPVEEQQRGYGGTTILAKDAAYGSSSV
jgi:molecular chaperone DnaK